MIRAPQSHASGHHGHVRPLTPLEFALRLLKHFGLASTVIGASLMIGALGYHLTEHLSWLDATLNAAMILTGMGPTAELHTDAGKLFAIFYALFSGIVFLSVVAILMTPVINHLLRRFHLETHPEVADAP